MNTQTEFTRLNNSVSGNPRYAFHFLALINEGDRIKANHKNSDMFGISTQYNIALVKAKKINGKKYHNKQYGGGIAVECYEPRDIDKKIQEIKEVNTQFKQDWDKKDLKRAEKAIHDYFSFHTHKYISGGESHKLGSMFSYDSMACILGLAYTSSSSYAGLWICNVTLEANERYNFIGFAINANNDVVGICQNEKEEELFIQL